MDADRALLVTSSGELWKIGATGPAELQCRTGLLQLDVGAFRPPDQLWIQGDGALVGIQVDLQKGGCTITASVALPTDFRALAVSAPPASLEVVGVGRDRGIYQLFEGRWSLLSVLEPPPPGKTGRGGAIWVGERSFAAADEGPVLAHVDAGQLSLAPIEVFPRDGAPTSVASMTVHPTLGLVLAIHKVGLVSRIGDGDVVLVPSAIELGAVTSSPEGLLYLDQAGGLGTFHAASGTSCTPAIGSGAAARRLVRLENGTLIASDSNFSELGGAPWAYRYYLPARCPQL